MQLVGDADRVAARLVERGVRQHRDVDRAVTLRLDLGAQALRLRGRDRLLGRRIDVDRIALQRRRRAIDDRARRRVARRTQAQARTAGRTEATSRCQAPRNGAQAVRSTSPVVGTSSRAQTAFASSASLLRSQPAVVDLVLREAAEHRAGDVHGARAARARSSGSAGPSGRTRKRPSIVSICRACPGGSVKTSSGAIVSTAKPAPDAAEPRRVGRRGRRGARASPA